MARCRVDRQYERQCRHDDESLGVSRIDSASPRIKGHSPSLSWLAKYDAKCRRLRSLGCVNAGTRIPAWAWPGSRNISGKWAVLSPMP